MKRLTTSAVITCAALLGAMATSAPADAAVAPPTLAWTHEHPTTSPGGRDSAGIANYAGGVVMFGGETATGGAIRDDTWVWSNGKWSEDTASVHPPALAGPGMAYDPVAKGVLLFGGEQANGTTSNQTWLWSATGWKRLSTPSGLTARVDPQMAYSPRNKGVLLFSGATTATSPAARTDTWLWTASGWKKLSPSTSPTGSLFGTMSSDPASGQVVLLTGLVSLSSSTKPATWIWNGTTWSKPTLTVAPTLRIGASSAYDPGRKAVVLFGGLSQSGKFLADAWSWGGTRWSKLVEATPPSARAETAMAYDVTSSKLLLFGGSTQVVAIGKGKPDLADTWVGAP